MSPARQRVEGKSHPSSRLDFIVTSPSSFRCCQLKATVFTELFVLACRWIRSSSLAVAKMSIHVLGSDQIGPPQMPASVFGDLKSAFILQKLTWNELASYKSRAGLKLIHCKPVATIIIQQTNSNKSE